MKKIRLQTIVFVLMVGLTSLIVFPAAAQIATVAGDPFELPDAGEPSAVQQFGVALVNAILLFVGLIAAIFLIFGGVQYITSAGDDQKTATAKKTILYAIVGLIVIGLSVAIVNFVVDAFQ